MVEAGSVPMSQLYDIRAQLANDEVTLTEAENNVTMMLLNLTQLLEIERIATDFDIVQPETVGNMGSVISPDNVFDNAVTFKPQIKQQEYLLASQRKLLNVARANFYPRLSFSAGYSNGYYSSFGNENIVNAPFIDQWNNNAHKSVNFSLSIPVFNQFSNMNNVRKAKLNILNQELQVESAKKTLYKEIQQAFFNAAAAHEKYLATEKSVAASREALLYAEERYAAGKSTVFEYNESKLGYARSLSQQAQAKYDFIFRAKILDFYNGIPIRL
jgi:outer membrane protein